MIEEEVGSKQKSCEEDLEKALPVLQAAQEALDTLNKVYIYIILKLSGFVLQK